MDIENMKEAYIPGTQWEVLLRAFMNNSIDTFCVANEQDSIELCSANIEQITGFSPQQIVHQKITSLLNHEDIKLFSQGESSLPSSPSNIRVRHKDGSWITCVGSATTLDNKKLFTFRRSEQEVPVKPADEKLRWLVEHTGDVIIELDANGIIRYVNQQLKKILWYDAHEVIGKKITFLSYIDDVTTHERELDKIKNTSGEPIYNKYRLRRKDGNIVWFDGTITNLLNIPAVNSIVISQREATHRLEHEEKAAYILNRHNMVLKATNDAIWEWNLADNKVYWGDGVKTLFGYDMDGASDIFNWQQHIHPEDRQRVISGLYKAINDLNQDKWEDEYRYVNANGKFAYVYDRGYIQRDENKKVIRMIGALQDVTERKANEQMLRISNERYKIVSRATNDAIWDWNLLTNEVFWSGAVKAIFGFKEKEIGYTNSWWISQVHPDDRAKLQKAFKEVLSTGREYLQIDYRFMCADGTYKYVHDRSFVIYEHTEAGKQPIRMVGALQDITQRKMAEQEMKNFSLLLEKRVKERTSELEALNNELESFSYSVSHDLRAPLRSINGFSQAIIEDYYEMLDETGKEYLDRIKANSQRMANLIDDLLKLSQITRHQLKKEEINLSVLVYDIIERLKESYDLQKVEFKIQDNLLVFADPKLLNIALTNLLDNALKFSHKSEKPVLIFARETTGAFLIKDNGIGFEVKYVNKVFEAFQRLQNQPEYPGTGIGLSIVHRIIKRHGGSIWANSQPGKGATFYFTL